MNPPYMSSYDEAVLDVADAPASGGPRRSAAQAARARLIKRVTLAVALGAALAVGLAWRAWTSPPVLTWSGTVEAHTVSVGSRVGGRVQGVLVHEGQLVADGQPLVRFEANDLQWKRVVAEAKLEEARAELEKLQNGPRPEELEQVDAHAQALAAALAESVTGPTRATRAAARARLAVADAEVSQRQRDAERARTLAKSGSIAEAQVAETQAAWSVATAARAMRAHEYEELDQGTRHEIIAQASARSREAAARAQLLRAGARAEELRVARARVSAAEGQLREQAAAVDELMVRAPRAARVEAIAVRPGDLTAANDTVVKLLEHDQVYVRMYVPETQLGHVRIGQSLRISVDSFPERVFEGRVEQLNGMGEYSPRNLQTIDERANQVFAARVALQSGREALRPGMAAVVRARP